MSFAIANTDAEGDATTMTWSGLPTFLSFLSPTLANNTAVTAAQAGKHSVGMRVCDVWNACTSSSFILWIDQAPVVSAGIPTVTCI